MQRIFIQEDKIGVRRKIRCRKRDGSWECVINIPPSLVLTLYGKIKQHLEALVIINTREKKLEIIPQN